LFWEKNTVGRWLISQTNRATYFFRGCLDHSSQVTSFSQTKNL
jgi:hypothetical protein